MSTVAHDDAGAPTIVVRIYDRGRLLTRELCESEDEAAEVVERWSDRPDLSFVVDDLGTEHGPDDILAPEEPLIGGDDDHPIATAPLPGYGTE